MNKSKLPGADVRLQILLRAEHRNPAGAKRAVAAARRLGLTATGTGAASLSARVPEAQLAKLFGPGVVPVSLSPPVALQQTPLPVPKVLAPYVESITVAPKHEKY